MYGFRSIWAAAVVASVLASCGEGGTTPSVTGAGKATDVATGSDGAAASDLQTSTDGGPPPVATCAGSAINEGFKALDKDCAFLGKCPSLGKCYCGDKCPASKTPKCDPSLCPNSKPKCFCGEACKPDQKKCPEYLCKDAGLENSAKCDELDDCVFVNTPPPSWCGCQKMPNHAPDCWCNASKCTEPRPECAASKCAGKSTDKCIYVKGEDYTSCWCDTCGLFGDTARCFFVLCPNG